MKLQILQENFKTALFVVSHIAGKNSNLPILNNILIEANGGNIKLVSTNLEIGINYSLRGKVETEGSFTVDAKILNDYVGVLPNKKIDLAQEGDKLLLATDNYQTKINGQSAEEYPLIPNVDKDDGFTVDLLKFKEALSQVVFAVSTSDTRLELTGVLMNIVGETLTLVATDSYRLTEKKINIQKIGERDLSVIVPAKTMQEVLRVIAGSKSAATDLNVYINDNQILFTYDSIEIVSRVIEGQYPDYKQIIPTISKTEANLSTMSLSRAIKAASLFTKSGVNDINLDFPKGKDKVIVSSASGLTGENITEVEAKTSGDDNGVVVNYRYIMDGLNNIHTDSVNLNVVDGNTPLVLRPDTGDDYLYIIMPIKQ
jgi:DNA polymerase-3 subunit beta